MADGPIWWPKPPGRPTGSPAPYWNLVPKSHHHWHFLGIMDLFSGPIAPSSWNFCSMELSFLRTFALRNFCSQNCCFRKTIVRPIFIMIIPPIFLPTEGFVFVAVLTDKVDRFYMCGSNLISLSSHNTEFLLVFGSVAFDYAIITRKAD